MHDTIQKNRAMRVAAALLVATILSTCMVGGTFAKYATSDTGSDSARVAKWGVTAVVSGSGFGAHYEAADGNKVAASYTGSVDSASTYGADDARLVAPGTCSDAGMTITISGTPEVKNSVVFSSVATSDKDVSLAAGSYGVMVAVSGITEDNFRADHYYKLVEGTYVVATTAQEAAYELHDAVTLSAAYLPIKWTVTGTAAGTYDDVASMMAALKAAYDATNDSLVAIDKTSTLTWAWAFSQDDGADTILGTIAAADADAVAVKAVSGGYATLSAGTDYCLDAAFDCGITITQVD